VVTVCPGGLPADGEGWRTVRSPAPSGARIPLLARTPAILSIQLIMMAAFLAGLPWPRRCFPAVPGPVLLTGCDCRAARFPFRVLPAGQAQPWWSAWRPGKATRWRPDRS